MKAKKHMAKKMKKSTDAMAPAAPAAARAVSRQATIEVSRNEPPHPIDGAASFCPRLATFPASRAMTNSRAIRGGAMAGAEFWYEFASTYSYPAALRVAALAEERGVSLVWRPFLLGPIFAAQGWRDSPFNIYPAKGRYMWRDVERTCEAMGVPFKRPEPFPQPSLLAARVALALEGEERASFSRQVYAG